MIAKETLVLTKVKNVLTDEDAMKELDESIVGDKNYLGAVPEKRLVALLIKSDIADSLKIAFNEDDPKEDQEKRFYEDLVKVIKRS